MTLFMTKVWGFADPCGPLQFSTNGARESARKLLKEGDRVILVGTLDEPTPPDEQGRVLGMMEPTREPVSTLDFDLPKDSWDYDEEGNYKWPFSLHNRRAWIFDQPRPLLKDVSDRRFSMDSAQGIVPLLDSEADEVLMHTHHDITLLPSVRAQARTEGADAARRRNAPPPTTTRSGVMHLRRAPAYTYAMQIEGAKLTAFKIGWAFDAGVRQRQFNQSSMPDLGGLRYRTKLTAFWPAAMAAFKMEQALLKHFDAFRHRANREVVSGVSYSDLESQWIAYFTKGPK
jgi:hypothetical protein